MRIDPHPRGAFRIASEVERMLYTVKEIAQLANVTVKTLHHYHKIGLLIPRKISESGYRLYGQQELERLQQILFYRELDFPLKEITNILAGESDRLSILQNQKQLLMARLHRLTRLVQTLDESIDHALKGEPMEQSALFKGFRSEEEWEMALAEQNEHIKETYDYDLLASKPIEVEAMNEMALESEHFMNGMACALREGRKYDDSQVKKLIRQHIDFLNDHGTALTDADFASQARFFVQDDFHRHMLEEVQTGLSYYLCFAAEAFASDQR